MKQRTGTAKTFTLLRISLLTLQVNPGWSLLMLLVVISLSIMQAAQIVIVRNVINAVVAVVAAGNVPTAGALISGLALFVGVLAASNLLYNMLPVLQGGFRESTVHHVRQSVFAQMARLSPIAYQDPAVHDRLSRVEAALSRSLPTWADSCVWFLQSLFVTVAVGIYVSRISTGLLALAIANGVLFLLPEGISQSNRHSLFTGQTPQHRREQYLTGLLTQKNSLRELLLFDGIARVRAKWEELVQALWAQNWKLERLMSAIVLAGRLVQTAVFGGALLLLVNLHAKGRVDPGSLVGALTALIMFQQSLAMLVVSSAGWFGQGIRMGDVFSLFRSHTVEQVPPATRDEPVETGAPGLAVALDGVSFQYPGSRQPAVADVTLQIRPGEKIAIVGENGSGKTTLAHLLLGIYLPGQGRITYDDIDATKAEFRMGSRSAVFQSFQRFALSVRDNIGFGFLPLHSADDTLMNVAATTGLNIGDMAPSPLEAQLGKAFGGHELSGGQWQRLALSRGLLPPSRLIVLDEVTSKLDPQAESELLHVLRDTLRSRTAVFVAHRLPMARLADRIVVMKGGRIVEVGDHSELLAKDGVYARFYKTQAGWYQEEQGR